MPKVKIKITLDGSGTDIEKYRRSILGINSNLDNVSVSYPQETLPEIKGEGTIVNDVEIGSGTVVWHYCNLFKCKIGKNCVIGSYVEIGKNVTIGNNCKIECGVFIPEGVTIEDEVFVGPHVVFTNDRFPKAKTEHWEITKTTIKRGASIGANATIRCGIIIGEGALVGCGAVVVNDVAPTSVVVGNPAKFKKFLPLKKP